MMAIILIVALFVDRNFKVERDIVINAPSEDLFTYLKELKNQKDWVVWQKTDPNIQQSFKGDDGQVGFILTWKSSNKEVGSGEVELTKIKYPNYIETQLSVQKPIKETTINYFEINETAENTEVKWAVRGKSNYPMNILNLFMNKEKKLGPGLEKSLKNLKKQLEQA